MFSRHLILSLVLFGLFACSDQNRALAQPRRFQKIRRADSEQRWIAMWHDPEWQARVGASHHGSDSSWSSYCRGLLHRIRSTSHRARVGTPMDLSEGRTESCLPDRRPAPENRKTGRHSECDHLFRVSSGDVDNRTGSACRWWKSDVVRAGQMDSTSTLVARMRDNTL